MKAFIIFLTFLSFAFMATASEVENLSHHQWIDTNSVLISNSQNLEIARRDCQTTMRILNIMSNNKIVFDSKCEVSYHPRCNYFYCYQLCVKALVIEDHRENNNDDRKEDN